MKAYIISFYQQEVSDDELVTFLDSKRDVLNLVRPLPNTIFIASDRNASFLAGLIERRFPKGFFIVAEYVPYNADGSLPGEMWEFLNKPKPKQGRKANKAATKRRHLSRAKSASERK
ncbi:MAG: hypothetical protein LC795_01750 [Acidobacteria bacterium]|nr:hypothetical protein [Acidobacteriota bacterium]